jgi:putative transposase
MRLDDSALSAWFGQNEVKPEAQILIQQIRSAEPAQRPASGRTVTGRYPSRKMGVTISFESHRVQLAALYELEHDLDVIEYYDRPPILNIPYETITGQARAALQTPTFVLRRGCAGWEEVRTEESLKVAANKSPSRYRFDGCWRSPSGEAYAGKFGLYYRVRSNLETNWTFQRNVQFLEDYFRSDRPQLSESAAQSIRGAVLRSPDGLVLSALLADPSEHISSEEIYAAIAEGLVFVDLHAAPLVEPGQVRVFPSAECHHLSARAEVVQSALPPATSSSRAVSVEIGTLLMWDNRSWRVANIGEAMVGLVRDDNVFSEIPLDALSNLIKEDRVRCYGPPRSESTHPEAKRLMSRASEVDLLVATERCALVHKALSDDGTGGTNGVPKRTMRRYLRDFRLAEERYGSGFVGLLPRTKDRGNKLPKLPETTLRLMFEHVEQDYETLTQKTRFASWASLRAKCEQRALLAPSYKRYCQAVKEKAGYEQTLKRRGRRAAYALESFYWELDMTTPRHGDRPFEIVHVDHTELDIQTVSSKTGQPMGKPWLTLMMDAYSRRVLAFHLGYDPPSYRSCMVVLRDCVRRNGRLPQILVVDGGVEFQSTYFETLLAMYEVTKKTRPAAKPRFGSVCERLFGTTNTQFIHNLRGNTQMSKSVREVTKANDPAGLAIWPLEHLYARTAEYFFDVYSSLTHPALGATPAEAFVECIQRTGTRMSRVIPYNRDFIIQTMPSTLKGTSIIRPSRGVKINHLFYWCDSFRDPDLQGRSVAVRYDPYDAGTAYAYVHKEWVECVSECHSSFRGKSEKELRIASEELRRQRQQQGQTLSLTAKKLAVFMESLDASQILLRQRMIDREQDRINPVSIESNTDWTPRSPAEINEQEPHHGIDPSFAGYDNF